MKSIGIAVLVAFAFSLSGCGTQQVRTAQAKSARSIQPSESTKPIQFRKVVAKMRRGDSIGEVQGGLACIRHQTLEWRGGRANITDEEFTETFREELERHNYTVVGDPNALFDDPSAWKAELLVAGMINSIEANICFPMAGFGNFRDAKGGVYLRVNWQIYGQLERKVILEASTEGSYQTTDTTTGGLAKLMTNAFAVAVQNLLADEGFRRLVVRPHGTRAGVLPTPTYADLAVDAPTRPQFGVAEARDAAVTVFAGPGHGSGFIVSPSGYILTNEHVVKEARSVKLRMANGREMVGDVVRTDPARDVALIRVRESNLPALMIRSAPTPTVGEEVYAIGTPFLEKFEVTVTRGVISAFREEDGKRFIQSDVQIHRGNSGGPLIDKDGTVVGIATMGFTRGGMTQSLNFFVPIDEALSRLKLSIR